jgi:hypothetical protein
MKKLKLLLFAAVLLVAAATGGHPEAHAQERYHTWQTRRGRAMMIPVNWKPDSLPVYKRYTVAVDPMQLINNGFKFDFETELSGRRTGEWMQAGLLMFAAPERKYKDYYYSPYYYRELDGNNRESYNSGYETYHKMWGVGLSVLFKKMFHRRGWYFSTGVKLEFYGVTANVKELVSFAEYGNTFYEQGGWLSHRQYFFKPGLQFNLGKHITLTPRCFFDVFLGVSYSYAFYDSGKTIPATRYSYPQPRTYAKFTRMDGFGYRGFSPNFGARFGVMLWKRRN